MYKITAFLVLSIPVVIVSWRSLSRLTNHGFYRFLAWECILWLAVNNITLLVRGSFQHPADCFMDLSFLLHLSGNRRGHPDEKNWGNPIEARDNSLHSFEKTTELVDSGIFRYHPSPALQFTAVPDMGHLS